MSRPRLTVKRALFLVTLLALAAFLWRPIQQTMAVVVLQNTVKRTNEAHFNSWDRPPSLPEWIDDPVCRLLDRWCEDHYISDGDRFNLQQDRFRSLFRGPIRSIEVLDPILITGDLGAALSRFPDLRQFTLRDGSSDITESDLTRLATRLRALPRLEYLDLRSQALTGAAIAPLVGHPGLRNLVVMGSGITSSWVTTLGTLPALRSVRLSEAVRVSEGEWILVCAKLRSIPQLEEIVLGGHDVTDAAIAPLAGHPGLRQVTISDGRVTPLSAATLVKIPHLTGFSVEHRYREDGNYLPFTADEQSAFSAALPRVNIVLQQ